jgi:DNA-binding transcriptional MerR regulator
MEPVLTIKQLADYVGVSTRTVRYYHQRGLLPEPERTHAGYRMYDADAVIRLTRITTLARSGVPLARIEELLTADPERFREGVAAIDRDLRDRIRELRHDRERLAHLESGERLCLPDLVCDYLDQLRAAGVPEGVMEGYRDSWLLTCALYGQEVDRWLAGYGDTFRDPAYVDLMARTLSLALGLADDPAVPVVAAEWVDWTIQHWEQHERSWEFQMSDPLANSVVESQWENTPGWTRMSELVVEGLHARGVDHPALDQI